MRCWFIRSQKVSYIFLRNLIKLINYFNLAQWISTTSKAALPNNAVLAGRDTDGSPIYVGRSTHGADLIPAKVIPSKQIAYISHGGSEISKHSFEVNMKFPLVEIS